MKIGIMGAQGTGKTTLLYKIAAAEKSKNPGLTVSILPEVARRAPGNINEKSTERNQEWIHLQQYCAEIEGVMNSDILISDRTVLDSLVYSSALGYEDQVDKYYKNMEEWMKTYDQLYFLRPDKTFRIAPDGVRSTDEQFRDKVDDNFIFFIEMGKIQCIKGRGGYE